MRLRAPVLDDAPAVLGVLVARDVADLGAPDHTLEDVLEEWRGLDLALDALVVEADDSQIVGYAAVRRFGTNGVLVPDYEDRGIGGRVLTWAERRERERGHQQHRQWVATKNTRAASLLRTAGYRRVRSYWRLGCRLVEGLEVGAAEVGVDLRPLAVDRDAVALHAVYEASFASNPDYQPTSFEAFCDEHLRACDLNAELSSVALSGGSVIGFGLTLRRKGEAIGYVDLLAVHPDHQSRGVGTALLVNAFGGLAAAGVQEAQLGVASDNPRALRLYERVGMTARFQTDTYERPIHRAPRQSYTPPTSGATA